VLVLAGTVGSGSHPAFVFEMPYLPRYGSSPCQLLRNEVSIGGDQVGRFKYNIYGMEQQCAVKRHFCYRRVFSIFGMTATLGIAIGVNAGRAMLSRVEIIDL
jgi:hypothetical protein